MSGYLFRFWLCALLSTAGCGLALHLWWAPQWRMLPRAPFPFSRTSFLNEYGERGIASHYLYWSGLFGFGQKMRQSDLILIGTSHVWFGLSASQLAQQLSAAEGRPVRVLNMGMGYADEAFQFHALTHNHVDGKKIVLDLYCPGLETISPWAAQVEKTDWFAGYIGVLEIWADGLRDWFLDPVVPRFMPGSHPRYLRTFLGSIVCRWDTNDTEYIWKPGDGYFYHRGTPPPPTANLAYSPKADCAEPRFSGNGNRGILYVKGEQQVVAANHLQPILVLMPFFSYRPDLAEQIAAQNQLPLVQIPLDGLRFFDWGHLNAPSRDIATQKLGDEIIRRRLLSGSGGK